MTTNSAKLKPCPFCGSAPEMKYIGNDRTKSRKITVKCSNRECRIERTDAGLQSPFEKIETWAIERWNRRTAAQGDTIDASEREFITKRLRRVAKLVGLEGAIPDGDDLIGCAGSVLGMIASQLERQAGSAEQVSEQAAEPDDDERFTRWCEDHMIYGGDKWIAWGAWCAALSAPERKVTDSPQITLTALHEFIDKFCLGKHELAATAESAFYAFNKSLLNQQGEQTAPEGWQSIETAPKDGTPILLGRAESEFHAAESTVGWWQEAVEDGVDYMGGDAGFVDFAFQVFNPGRSFGNPSHMYAADQPTHWRPLPEAPSTAQKDGGKDE